MHKNHEPDARHQAVLVTVDSRSRPHFNSASPSPIQLNPEQKKFYRLTKTQTRLASSAALPV